MDDSKIIDLYFCRDEKAIDETRSKYGRLLMHIAYGILHSEDESNECVYDTYMNAWEAIPPARPTYFRAFLAKITRNLSVNKYLKNRTQRTAVSTETVIGELADMENTEGAQTVDDIAINDALNSFLGELDKVTRIIFVKRYFYVYPIKKIALDMRFTESNVKVILMRTREKLKAHLEKAGVII